MIAVLIEASIRSLFIAGGVWLALKVGRARSGAAQHAAWTAVLLAMLTSPLLTWWQPNLPVTVPHLPVAELVQPATTPDIVNDTATRVVTSPARSDTPPTTDDVPLVSAAAAAPDRPSPWAALMIAIWLTGVCVLLGRLGYGWYRSTWLLRRCEPIDGRLLPVQFEAPLVASPAVATPVVLGAVNPRIVLPANWPTWTTARLRAALLHEHAHVWRRDMLVALVARVNRCVFWFHPLAWWLERTLATTAEQSCDDVVVREMADGREYAALLVDMAAAVHARGGLVAWHGVGIGGSGRLDSRIDRILAGDALHRLPRARAALLTILCGLAISSGVACQQQPPPLQPDPEFSKIEGERQAQTARVQAAMNMTAEQAAVLEEKVATDTNDLAALEDLIVFYVRSGQKALGWSEMITRRRTVVVRLIERHPESTHHRWVSFPQDPEGRAAARAAWLAQVAKPGISAAALGNAADFFNDSDRPLAEELLLRARALDPDGRQAAPTTSLTTRSWDAQLGTLYGEAIVESFRQSNTESAPTSAARDRARFTEVARGKLEATAEADMLFAAASFLRSAGRRNNAPGADQMNALAQSYSERARALAPDSDWARSVFRSDVDRERSSRFSTLVGSARKDARSALAGLSEQERFELGADAAVQLVMTAGGIPPRGDPARRTASFAAAGLFAEAALDATDRFTSHSKYGHVVFHSQLVLAAVAVEEADQSAAVRHMRAAGEAPPSEAMATGEFWQPDRVINNLLRIGERESVIAFMERMAVLNVSERDRWLADARAIREGRMTKSYQTMFGTNRDWGTAPRHLPERSGRGQRPLR